MAEAFKEEFFSLTVSPLKDDNLHAMHEVGVQSCWVEALSLGECAYSVKPTFGAASTTALPYFGQAQLAM